MNASLSRPASIPVLVADSNLIQAELLTGALRRRPEFQVSICEGEETQILQALSRAPIKVIVFSLHRSAAARQLSMVRTIHLAHPETCKILLVETCEPDLAITAFRCGVRGIFCVAGARFRLLCRCILRVAQGQVWASSEQLGLLIDVVSQVPSLRVFNSRGLPILTPREEQVVALAAEGLSNRDISRELSLSQHTVKKYLFRIFDKLGVSSRVELVLYAMNHGNPLQAQWIAGHEEAAS